jgi:Ser-tRNA(Ala) deacylase AlaX
MSGRDPTRWLGALLPQPRNRARFRMHIKRASGAEARVNRVLQSKALHVSCRSVEGIAKVDVEHGAGSVVDGKKRNTHMRGCTVMHVAILGAA